MNVDFNGWRYFELIETESARHCDYDWGEGHPQYQLYRESVRFNTVESLSIWYNNLPPDSEVECFISAVKALPMVPVTLKNPSVALDGQKIVFPVEMQSGSYLEFKSASDCKLYGPKGELLAEVAPEGNIPKLLPGENQVSFSCEDSPEVNARAIVTVISIDKPL